MNARIFAAQGENRLLASLPGGVREELLGRSERVALDLAARLFKANESISHIYFPLSGVISLVLRMSDGTVVEVATIGNEGLVGSPVFLGAGSGSTDAVCQVPGEVVKLPVDFIAPEPLHALARRYIQALMTQISQSTACNHLHSVQERMCRWLLMTHDRVASDELALTQEFLAQMLAVRRPSVTVVARALQQRKLIQYRRGRIRILDREGLEEGACECYHVVRREFERLFRD
jgi:CRP-like cAMP-binding protein